MMNKNISNLLTNKYVFMAMTAIAFFCLPISSIADSNKAAPARLKIVTTIFPEYDWVKQILGSKVKDADIVLLTDKGVDLHSYSPSVSDIAKIANSDLFIYAGGESDGWVKNALINGRQKNRQVINMITELGNSIKEEIIVEGMQTEVSNECANSNEKEYDEHVWLSLRMAEKICTKIADKLAIIDPANSRLYKKNAKEYVEMLKLLDKEYMNTVSASRLNTVVFGDRFPFRYMVDDYGLRYYAAFVGCSAETEASFKTIIFLAKKIDELNLKSILTIEGAKHNTAETIAKNTHNKNIKILTMNSMQSTVSADKSKGYLDIMRDNLKVLSEALK